MIKIGYLGSDDSTLASLELLEETHPTNIGLLGGSLKRCPSVRGYHMNTFEVKCPFDLEWTVSHTSEGVFCEVSENTTQLANILLIDEQGTNCQVKLRPMWSFISDTPNTIILQHTNGIDTNPQIVSGMFDIYNWPDRAISIGYSITKKEQTFKLKRGEPWYRVTFITPDLEPVKLIKMTERSPFLIRTQNKDKLTTIKYLNWRKIFKYFGKTRPKKLIR